MQERLQRRRKLILSKEQLKEMLKTGENIIGGGTSSRKKATLRCISEFADLQIN